MSGRTTSRPAGLVVAVLTLLLTSVASPAQAALGAALQVEGGNPATIERGDSIELSWITTDAESVEGWVHQDLQRVDVPGWSGPLATGGTHTTTVTVDLPPGRYFFVVEAGDGLQRAVSSVAVDVLAGEGDVDGDTGSDDSPPVEDPPPAEVAGTGSATSTGGSGTGDARTGTRFPDRAPRAGRG